MASQWVRYEEGNRQGWMNLATHEVRWCEDMPGARSVLTTHHGDMTFYRFGTDGPVVQHVEPTPVKVLAWDYAMPPEYPAVVYTCGDNDFIHNPGATFSRLNLPLEKGWSFETTTFWTPVFDGERRVATRRVVSGRLTAPKTTATRELEGFRDRVLPDTVFGWKRTAVAVSVELYEPVLRFSVEDVRRTQRAATPKE